MPRNHLFPLGNPGARAFSAMVQNESGYSEFRGDGLKGLICERSAVGYSWLAFTSLTGARPSGYSCGLPVPLSGDGRPRPATPFWTPDTSTWFRFELGSLLL